MITERDDQICALCKWSRESPHNYFCGHFKQSDESLKTQIHYNDTCELFEEKEDRKNLYNI